MLHSEVISLPVLQGFAHYVRHSSHTYLPSLPLRVHTQSGGGSHPDCGIFPVHYHTNHWEHPWVEGHEVGGTWGPRWPPSAVTKNNRLLPSLCYIFVFCLSGSPPFWIRKVSILLSPFPSPIPSSHHPFPPHLPNYSTITPLSLFHCHSQLFSSITLSPSSPPYLLIHHLRTLTAYCSICPNHLLQWTCRIPWRPSPLVCP